jgi:hypothetical protein
VSGFKAGYDVHGESPAEVAFDPVEIAKFTV